MTAIVPIDSQVIWCSSQWPLRITHSAGEYVLEERSCWPGSPGVWADVTRTRSGADVLSWADIEECRLAARDAVERFNPFDLVDRRMITAIADAIDAREPDEVRELICELELPLLDEEMLLSEIEPYLRIVEQRLCGGCKSLRTCCVCVESHVEAR